VRATWAKLLRITVDHREKASGLVGLLKEEDVVVEVKHVRYGDYVIDGFATIERKTAKDFLVSIIDGRLFNQLANLKRYCQNPLILVEGDPYQTLLDFNPNAIKGAFLSVQAMWRIPVILSEGKEDTKNIMLTIGRQHEKHVDVVPLREGYRPGRLKSRQLFVLQGFPKVGPKLAKRLIERFRSVSRVMNATVGELAQVDGIGSVSAEQIREVLDSEIP
jgi:Fanconi anemia group M protein